MNGQIVGWIYNSDVPAQVLSIDIYDFNQKIGTVNANMFRNDLLNSGIGDGSHAFFFPVPSRLLDYQAHLISVTISGTPIQLSNSPKWFPCEPLIWNRVLIASNFLKGNGIEIGALHNPLPIQWISQIENVRYVDRFDVERLRSHYPELNHLPLVPVDIIDDGETLTKIQDGSLDFIIANHMLEHCQNPLGTLRNHLNKIKDGGIIYLAVPDKRYTFDRDRELTSFAHLVRDDQQGSELSKKQHFIEWVTKVSKIDDEEQIQKELLYLMEIDYSIHFHVWDAQSFREFLSEAILYLNQIFTVEFLIENHNEEIICILKKAIVNID